MTIPFFLEIIVEPIKARHAKRVKEKEEERKRQAEAYRRQLEAEAKRRAEYRKLGLPYHSFNTHRWYD